MKILALCLLPLLLISCEDAPSSNKIEQDKQEVQLKQMAAKLGMPAIINFREKMLLKQILEMRDKNIATYTYSFSEYSGKFRFVGNSVGYGVPAATQYTSPTKIEHIYSGVWITVPQADPNGLYSPSSAEGTYIIMKDPNSKDVQPVYFEARMNVSPFKLPASVVE